MDKMPSSIFNDVIGPVMRGPSSSHVAAAARIGQLIRMSATSPISRVIVDFDPNGSLAESYHGHGSDIGLAGGLLGMDVTDPDLCSSLHIAEERGVEIQFRIVSYGATHPNYYRIRTDCVDGKSHVWGAISVGGGMVELKQLDEFDLSVCGDFHELLIHTSPDCIPDIEEIVQQLPSLASIQESRSNGEVLLEIKTIEEIPEETVNLIRSQKNVYELMRLEPILPTKGCLNCVVPFHTADQLLSFSKNNDREMWQMATLYESVRGNTTENAVYKRMDDLVSTMLHCVEEGISGTQYKDRILGPQAFRMDTIRQQNPLIPSELLSNIIRNITAIMEVKSSFGVIVAAPTAGSCGCLPGTVTGIGKTLKLSQDTMTKGMLAAALIGIFISEQATFSAEIAGCQAECGAGSAMAAAAVVQMLGGSVKQCCDAASLALQNVTGLVCDPVANRVEVPCLGKNIMGGTNAIAAASMILAGYDAVIPLDETILAMYDIGRKLPAELRCTLGGLGKTPTSMKISEKLNNGT